MLGTSTSFTPTCFLLISYFSKGDSFIWQTYNAAISRSFFLFFFLFSFFFFFFCLKGSGGGGEQTESRITRTYFSATGILFVGDISLTQELFKTACYEIRYATVYQFTLSHEFTPYPRVSRFSAIRGPPKS